MADDSIDNLVEDMVNAHQAPASKLPAKARAINIKSTVASFSTLAYEEGIVPAVLDRLIDLVTIPNYLDQASLASVVRNLYPAERVSPNVVLHVVSALGHGALKAPLSLQAALLKWLVMVYHVLETPAVLAQAYSVLFNLLDTAAIRLNLSRQTGNDPPLVGLLRVFKDYYPEIIVGEAVRGKASAFKHPDLLWRSRLAEIQDAHRQRAAEQRPTGPQSGFRVNRPVNRAQRNKAVPIVLTSHATEDSVTLEEVEDVSSFVAKMDKLELPNQLVAVLADPLLQKLLILRPNPESYQRISNWLSAVFQEVMAGDADEATLWEVLEVVREFVVQTKTIPPLLLSFFSQFFNIWGGEGKRDVLFDILGFTPLHDFGELHRLIFQPLEAAVQYFAPNSQQGLLQMYTNLLRHWTAILQASDTIPDHASATIASLILHTNTLALTLLQTSPSVTTDASILDFYEQTTRVITDSKLKRYMRIELPPSPLIYTFLFNNSLATVSRICFILACYKRGIETAVATRPRAPAADAAPRIDSHTYDRPFVNLFNGYIMDICNLFWRNRAFNDTDTNAQACTLSAATVNALAAYAVSVDRALPLTSLFSLSHSPVLCYQSIERVRDLEDDAMEHDSEIRVRHGGPVTQSTLTRLANAGGMKLSWQDYRIEVLKSLADSGFPGIPELLKNAMTVLKRSIDGGLSIQGTPIQP
ncbi:Mis6 domain-containing protein [Metarhizium acridum CQMa 102]|uniref:Mis6 domain-containing protein n=1 Tax=Metarhizium acridum (strain CQMa 102) TaxID=655827 RepID=E9E5F8_METAQ|nr:Mis6 domain-containing protein [Metarhizium acridum CQMa 102]EFY88841.1 Mis6 domain-containing protein [Metarhizium acridum CQMa 102]